MKLNVCVRPLSTLTIAFLLGVMAPMALQGAEDPLVARTFTTRLQREVETRYWLYLPDAYPNSGNQTWPLMIFLHGAGERGDDLEKVKVHGPPKLATRGTSFPFLMAAPQCPEGRSWDDAEILALLDHLQRIYRVDPARVYLTGPSMGDTEPGVWVQNTPIVLPPLPPFAVVAAPSTSS